GSLPVSSTAERGMVWRAVSITETLVGSSSFGCVVVRSPISGRGARAFSTSRWSHASPPATTANASSTSNPNALRSRHSPRRPLAREGRAWQAVHGQSGWATLGSMAPDEPRATAAHLVLYDGTCGFCAHTVQWILAADPAGRVRFAPLQGSTATAL